MAVQQHIIDNPTKLRWALGDIEKMMEGSMFMDDIMRYVVRGYQNTVHPGWKVNKGPLSQHNRPIEPHEFELPK